MADKRPKPAIALVGDYTAASIAHQAIPDALKLCGARGTWVPTAEVGNPPRTLSGFDAVWLVPASPYQDMDGALAAVRYARETKRPFLGSCGGFQHALIEIARNLAGIPDADHAESAPAGRTLVVSPLGTPLVEKTQQIWLVPGSHLHRAYNRDEIVEEYSCSYGLGAPFCDAFARTGVTFTAFDDSGDIRGFELSPVVHPFFVGTLFQSERRALKGEAPPIVRALVDSCRGGAEAQRTKS